MSQISHVNIPIELPPCGMLIGTGIMNSVPDYLVCSGRVHTTWIPQLFSPTELLDKILEDNQGNFVQYWGFSGGLSPITFARHYALEDIGITPPNPDWENRRNLLVEDWIDRKTYAERSGAGVLKLIEKAKEKQLYIALLYTTANPKWSQQFQKAGGKYYIGYDFGERFTFRLDKHSSENLDTVTLRTLTAKLMQEVSEHVRQYHENGWGNVAATSSNFHLDYEIAAGADIPFTEDFAFKHLNLSSALSRGLMRQYRLPLWGSHLAHEHYSWIPYSSPYKFPLLRAAMNQKYMTGAKIILNESGGWYLEAQLVTDSPMFETPRFESGGHIQNRNPHDFAHLIPEARKHYDKINYHSPTSQRYRKEISDFYNFVKTNGTPQGQPETTIALIKGNLDLGGAGYSINGVIAGMHELAEKNPLWFSGQPERGWDIACQIFYPKPPVLAPWHNLFLSGSPYGQVDIASFANDNIDADFLSENYRALLFTGWNTASEKQYAALLRYVENGGTLFVSIPHLSTNTTRNYASFGVDELVHGGDFSDLCGVKVLAKGRRFYWATSPDYENRHGKGELGFEFPRRFGILTVCMGDIEITDQDSEILAVDDEEMYPVLLRRKCGKGTVYFLNTWAYPGATAADFGPGAPLDSPGLAGYIYRHIARQNRPSVWISDDQTDAGGECKFINYSHFPEDGTICLHNIDFEKAHRFYLHRPQKTESIELAPAEFRILK